MMEKNPKMMMCGSNIELFENSNNNTVLKGKTSHQNLIKWSEYKQNPSHWVMNHSTLCYRKNEILSIGGYNENIKIGEDFELEVKVLKEFGFVYNIEKTLLRYRIHENQMTYNDKNSTPEIIQQKTQFINNMIM